eukprot:CAMPEP_0180679280 /NCGR_PEP_ID=MMETSP1037_2-20121125/68841_1 /TAXON_ID=632150 /ORGANISM="Azadinium spinosum, Strain 3D9" /LENGTH=44 /DNA_ID= /DNA_START= /DNA_END= /DNA_ORIENTATION=
MKYSDSLSGFMATHPSEPPPFWKHRFSALYCDVAATVLIAPRWK